MGLFRPLLYLPLSLTKKSWFPPYPVVARPWYEGTLTMWPIRHRNLHRPRRHPVPCPGLQYSIDAHASLLFHIDPTELETPSTCINALTCFYRNRTNETDARFPTVRALPPCTRAGRPPESPTGSTVPANGPRRFFFWRRTAACHTTIAVCSSIPWVSVELQSQ